MNAIPDTLAGHDSPAAQRQLTKHLERHTYDAAAEEIAATRLIKEAIKALPAWACTPRALGHVCAVLSTKIQNSGWSHCTFAEDAQTVLDELHDALSGAEVQS